MGYVALETFADPRRAIARPQPGPTRRGREQRGADGPGVGPEGRDHDARAGGRCVGAHDHARRSRSRVGSRRARPRRPALHRSPPPRDRGCSPGWRCPAANHQANSRSTATAPGRRRPGRGVTCSPATASGSPPASVDDPRRPGRVGRVAGQPAEPAARRVALPAAAAAARAQGARSGRRPCGRARRRTRGPRGAATPDPTKPPPMPVPEGDEHDVAAPRSRTGHDLGPRRAVGVVVDHHGQAEERCQAVAGTSRPTTPGRLGAARRHPVGVDQPGDADTHGDGPRPRSASSLSTACAAVAMQSRIASASDGVGPTLRGEDAVRVGGVDRDREHLGATDVDSDGDGHDTIVAQVSSAGVRRCVRARRGRRCRRRSRRGSPG